MGAGTEESPGSITWNNLVNLSADARIAGMFVERSIKSRVRALMEEFPAVAILGPRQSGKTTLALDLISPSDTYLDLELPSDRAKLADPESFFASRPEGLVVLDEIHRVPELFAVMRGVIDRRRVDGRRGGQFLLLGSADRDLLKQSSESLAGRLATVELTPLLVEEVPDADLETLWLRGGFPDSFLARSAPASFRWRQEFIATYLERDIVQFAPRVASETVRRLWTMLAYEQGQLLNAAKLAGSLGISGSTVSRYIDLLVDLLLVRRLPAWHSNQRKRFVRSPKVYVRDSGLVHSLLGLQEIDELLGNPVVGGSWEGWVIEQLIAAGPERANHSFYRTSAGAEIDLVIEFPDRERWGIEIKRSRAPSLDRGFHVAADDLGLARRYLVYPGVDRFRMGGVEVLGVLDLVAELRAVSR